MTNVKFQRGITTKLDRQALRFLSSACLLTIIQFQNGITTKLYRQELQFLCSAHYLMMLYISLKFLNNILNGFQVIEQTRNNHSLISKGNNSKNI